MIKVLFLSQWYPNRYDLMAGLFVQKHAEAVSLYCDVKVLYVHAAENIKHIETEKLQHENFSELIVYFPVNKNSSCYTVKKTFNYLKAYYTGFKLLNDDNFKPDIVHVNILTRTGFIAFLYNKFKGVPYLITEHWSRYLAERKGYNGIIRKFVTRLVVRNAKAVLPVSEILKNAMINHKLLNDNYKVINNVVDHYFYEETTLTLRKKKRMIHISCFDEQAKNVKGIIRATFELSKIRDDFELILIGIGIDFQSVTEYSDSLDFPKGVIHFLGEKTPEEVANWLQNSDFLILFSNYETAGVVIAESLVCGKPVLSTHVGAAPEYLNETNGIIIPVADEKKLIEKMSYLLDNLTNYNPDKIRDKAMSQFSYQHVGSQLHEIYKNAL